MFEKKEFSCPQAEATFTQSMEKLGISLSCSEEGRGWSCELEIRSDFSKSSESRSSSRSCSEHTYSCTTQFSYVPLASAHLAQEQIRLSQEALEELKSIEDLVGLAEGPARLHALRSKCERFFCRFGSHINQGPLHLGGIFWWKAVVEGFREEQREDVRRQTCNALESYIRSGYSDLGMKVTAEVGGSLSEISFKSKETKSLQMDIQLSVTMTGGPSDVNSLTRWKAGMVASNKTWCVIDRGHRLLSVWDLILSNHRQDFQDVLQVSHQLVEAYTALTGRSDGIPCAKGLWSKEEEFSSFLADVKSWEVTDPEKQLKNNRKMIIPGVTSASQIGLCRISW
uniref:MACPF domain-containing protein n=1 Tax=Ornithorhynchus anatinus TaxID=9258 RepID=A0A6I8NHA5_ORNAN